MTGKRLENLRTKIQTAMEKDPTLLSGKAELATTLGHNPDYLLDILGITKQDLIRLEKLGFAMKARYVIENKTRRGRIGVTGPHRNRWIIFSEVLDAK